MYIKTNTRTPHHKLSLARCCETPSSPFVRFVHFTLEELRVPTEAPNPRVRSEPNHQIPISLIAADDC